MNDINDRILFKDDFHTTVHIAVCLLSKLGITANYDGFLHTAYAISLAVETPEKLRSVTNFIYPEVAARYITSPDNVRKNIAKIRDIAWERNPELLSEIAMHQIRKKPGTAEFLAILTIHLIFC